MRSKETIYTESRRRTRQSCETYLSGLLDLIGCVGGITVNLLSLDSLRSTTNTHCLSVLEDDLELLWEAILNMFEVDHSAARGNMAVRELIVFKHSKELGDCPAYKLFDAVEVKRNEGVEYPRKYQDYTVTVHEEQIPDSVEVRRMN